MGGFAGVGSGVQQTGSQVYYDPQKGKYYTINTPQQEGTPNALMSILSPIFNQASDASRNYLGSSLENDKYSPQVSTSNYPDMNQLFPALNAGLTQNLQQSLLAPTDTQSSGASRFFAPSNTSKGK